MDKLFIASKLSEAIGHVLQDRVHQAREAIQIAFAYTDKAKDLDPQKPATADQPKKG